MSIETVARRYAAALADVVMKSGETQTVQAELRQWETLLSSNTELQNAFGNPAISHVNKEKVLEQLISRSVPSKATANFLRVLLRNGRLMEIDEINEKFAAVLEERSGIVSAAITSARELPSEEKEDLKRNLEKLTGRQVNINFSIDENIIGGVVTRIGSMVYDGSVKTQLENLREQLVNG
jgi:F-type H+-transporting ATPase subunit delta